MFRARCVQRKRLQVQQANNFYKAGVISCLILLVYSIICISVFRLSLSLSVIFRKTLHGVPTAITFSGISPVTTLPAPITLPFPICTPARIVEFAPIHTFCQYGQALKFLQSFFLQDERRGLHKQCIHRVQ